MKRYVVGFYFANEFRNVLLIEKETPEWQKGKVNGIGGHIEDGESPIEAMAREFDEEVGVEVEAHRWYPIVTLRGHTKKGVEFALHAFATTGEVIDLSQQSYDEGEVGWYRMWMDVPLNPRFTCVWNLHWLLPLSVDLLSNPDLYLETDDWIE